MRAIPCLVLAPGANAPLLACSLRLAPSERFDPISAQLVRAASRHPAAALDLWCLLAEADAFPSAMLGDLVSSLLAAPPPPHAPASDPFGVHPTRPAPPEPALAARFLAALLARDLAGPAAEAVAALSTRSADFPPDLTWLDTLAGLPPAALASPPAASLWAVCAGHYLARSEHPPVAPTDWSLPYTIPAGFENDPEIIAIAAFLRSPVRTKFRYKAAEAKRQRIEHHFNRTRLDLLCTVERKGTPYTLVCTKTRATHERAVKLHGRDLAAMRRLLAMGDLAPPLATRLREALARGGGSTGSKPTH